MPGVTIRKPLLNRLLPGARTALAVPSAHTRNYARNAYAKHDELSKTLEDSGESATA